VDPVAVDQVTSVSLGEGVQETLRQLHLVRAMLADQVLILVMVVIKPGQAVVQVQSVVMPEELRQVMVVSEENGLQVVVHIMQVVAVAAHIKKVKLHPGVLEEPAVVVEDLEEAVHL
jgi:lipoate synthase